MRAPWLYLTLSLANCILASEALACDRVTPAVVAGSAGEVLKELAAGDTSELESSERAMSRGIDCLAYAPSPREAAQIHAAYAALEWARGDLEAADASLRSSYFSDPTYSLPPELRSAAPELAGMEESARRATDSPRRREVAPQAYVIFFDGVETFDRPEGRPTLVVVLDPVRSVYQSARLSAAEPVPIPTIKLPKQIGPFSEEPTVLWSIGATSALAATALWTAYGYNRSSLLEAQSLILADMDEETVGRDAADIRKSVQRLHLQSAGASTLSALALASFGAAIVVTF